MVKTALFIALAFSTTVALAGTEIRAVSVNYVPSVDVVLQELAGELLISQSQAEKLNLQGAGTDYTIDGQAYYSLTKLGELKENQDGGLLLIVDKKYLPRREVTFKPYQNITLPSWSNGAYLNYNIQAQDNSQPRILTDANIAVGGWVINNQYIQAEKSQRIGTSATYEDVQNGNKWVVGDAYSSSTQWSQSFRFGGVQFRTDNSLQPWNPTTPVISVSGEARAPSYLEYYMNNILIRRQQVDPGTFQVKDIPVMSGGNANLVVRDALGQTQVLSVPTFYPAGMLAEGKRSYSVEAGALRTAPDTYGQPFASGTYRAGITPYITVEGHADYTSNASDAGIGGVIATPIGTVEAGTIQNSKEQRLNRVALYHQSNVDGISLNANISRVDTAGFTALDNSKVSASSQAGVSVSGLLNNKLSLQANHSEYGGYSYDTLGATYRLKDWLTFMMSMDHDDLGKRSIMFSLYWHWDKQQIKADISGATRITPEGQTRSVTVNAYQPGWYGWRSNVYATQNDIQKSNYLSAKVAYNGQEGEYWWQHYSFNNTAQDSLSVRGSLVLDDGKAVPSRWIDSSYIKVAAPAGASIFQNGQKVAEADQAGRAIVPFVPAHSPVNITAMPAGNNILSNLQPYNYKVATYTHAGAALKFEETPTGFFAKFHSADGKEIVQGKVVVDGKEFFISARGAFIDLPAGEYSAIVGNEAFQLHIPKLGHDKIATIEFKQPEKQTEIAQSQQNKATTLTAPAPATEPPQAKAEQPVQAQDTQADQTAVAVEKKVLAEFVTAQGQQIAAGALQVNGQRYMIKDGQVELKLRSGFYVAMLGGTYYNIAVNDNDESNETRRFAPAP